MWASIVNCVSYTDAGDYVVPVVVAISVTELSARMRAIDFILHESEKYDDLIEEDVNNIVENWLLKTTRPTVYRYYENEYKGTGKIIDGFEDCEKLMVLHDIEVNVNDIIIPIPTSVYVPYNNNLKCIDTMKINIGTISDEMLRRHEKLEYPTEVGD